MNSASHLGNTQMLLSAQHSVVDALASEALLPQESQQGT